MKSNHAIHCKYVLFNYIALHSMRVGDHWHDSHVGLSRPQNLMSVAAAVVISICICAFAATVSNALGDRVEPLASLPKETEFIFAVVTVDFSAWVADIVRR